MLEGDSIEYEILRDAAEKSCAVDGITCEIGLRLGYGSQVIMEGRENKPVTHIAIDPFMDDHYNGEMYSTCMAELFKFAKEKNYPLQVFKLEDSEFFIRYYSGIPLYNGKKSIVNTYSLVHYDGPHTVEQISREVLFFSRRTPTGGYWVFDDTVGFYDHSIIDKQVKEFGFSVDTQGKRKISYRRETC